MEFFNPSEVIALGCSKKITSEQQAISLSPYQITLQSDICQGKVCIMLDPTGKVSFACKNNPELSQTRESLRQLY
jgi:hypothetical protein